MDSGTDTAVVDMVADMGTQNVENEDRNLDIDHIDGTRKSLLFSI